MIAQHVPDQASYKWHLREKMAQAVERLIAAMDQIDGDPDLELEPDFEITCEDEGAQCDDEGHDSDTELNGDEGDYSQSEDEGPSYLHGLQTSREQMRGPSEVKYLDMDSAGNVSFMLDGQRWIGGKLNPP